MKPVNVVVLGGGLYMLAGGSMFTMLIVITLGMQNLPAPQYGSGPPLRGERDHGTARTAA